MQDAKLLSPFRIINPKIVFGTIGLVLVSILVGVILYSVDQYETKKIAAADSNKYFEAISLLDRVHEDKAHGSTSDTDETLLKQAHDELAELINSPAKGVQNYSLLRLADLDAQEGNDAEAITHWHRVYLQTNTKSPLHDFSRYMELNAQMKQLSDHPENFDKSKKDAIRVGYLDIIKENNGWKDLATEGLVAFDLHSEDPKVRAEAQQKLKQLAMSGGNSLDVRRRANLLLPALKPDTTTSKAGN